MNGFIRWRLEAAGVATSAGTGEFLDTDLLPVCAAVRAIESKLRVRVVSTRSLARATGRRRYRLVATCGCRSLPSLLLTVGHAD
jgi:hypothetical protein